jgi:hypothetical protein
MVSQDGGGPFASKRGDGHASDTQIFHDRAAAFLTTFPGSPPPRYLLADRTLYSEDQAAQLTQRGVITRIPGTLKRVAQGISPARRGAPGDPVDDAPRSQRLELCHYGMAQRWWIVSSEAAGQRAEHRGTQAPNRELAPIQTPLFHFQAKRCETHESAQAALRTLAGAWRYHAVATTALTAHKR